MRVASIILALSLPAIAGPALAAKADYCAAYARDFADARTKDKPLWQHKYDIALAACMVEPTKSVVAKPAPPKQFAPKIEPEPIIPPEPIMVEKPAKLVAGSPEWNDYCIKKYNSFNIKKGTYLSRTGVERKCLVN